jgi:MFS family permease
MGRQESIETDSACKAFSPPNAGLTPRGLRGRTHDRSAAGRGFQEAIVGRLQRIGEFFALKKSIVGMLVMVVLVGMGEQIGERYLPRYIQMLTGTEFFNLAKPDAHNISLLAVIAIGILAGMDDFLSAIYSMFGGWVSDRIGTKRALLVFNVLSMIGYLVVIFVQHWWAVLVGAAFFISWSAISLPPIMEIISKAVHKTKRTMGVSVQSLVRRGPKILGPVIGGSFIAVWGVVAGVRLAFVAALGLALAGMIIQQLMLEDDRKHKSHKAPDGNILALYRQMNPALRNLLVSDILIRFCERIPDCFVIIWCTVRILHPISDFTFGWLSAVENIVAVLCYIPVAHMADRFGKRPFVAVTFAFFALFPLALYFTDTLWMLVPVFVLRGLKEFGEPTRKALIMDLAPEDRKAAMFGLYYLLRDVIVSVAAFGGALLWWISPETNLLVAFGFGVIGTTWFVLRGRDVASPSQVTVP